jgi:hypothetical protein
MGCSRFEVKSLVVNIIDHLLPSAARFNVQSPKLNIHIAIRTQLHNLQSQVPYSNHSGTAFECTRALSFNSYAFTAILQRLSVMMVCLVFITRHRYSTHVAM